VPFVLEAGVPELVCDKPMIESPRNPREHLAPGAPRPEEVVPAETLTAGSALGRAICVCWMGLVLLGFLAIRVIGSQSFQALHLFGKAH
jgi:hypothetical protein